MSLKRFGGCAALALLVGFAGHAAAQERLSGPEIRKLVAGRSATWVTGDGGYRGTIAYSPNGTLTGTTRVFGVNQNVTGTWEVRGDRFCRTVSLDLVRTRCQTVQRASGSVYRFFNEDGRLATTTTFN